MGRQKDVRRKIAKGIIGGTFTPILDEELDSTAFRQLSGYSVKVFLYFKRLVRQLRHKNGGAEIIFEFPYSRAKKMGLSESTYRRALHALWEVGFLDVVKIGGLRGAGKTNSQYKLSNNWKAYGDQWKDRTKYEQNPFSLSEPKDGW